MNRWARRVFIFFAASGPTCGLEPPFQGEPPRAGSATAPGAPRTTKGLTATAEDDGASRRRRLRGRRGARTLSTPLARRASRGTLERLPHDLAAHVLCMLPPRARARCAAVCRSWRALVRELPRRNGAGASSTSRAIPTRRRRCVSRTPASVHPRPTRPERPPRRHFSRASSRPQPPRVRALLTDRPGPPTDRPPPVPPSTQVTREAIHAAAGLARARRLRVLRVPGEATVTRASLVSIVRAHRESSASSTPTPPATANAAGGPQSTSTPSSPPPVPSFAVSPSTFDPAACAPRSSRSSSPRRFESGDWTCALIAALAGAEKIALFDAARRLPRTRRGDATRNLFPIPSDETLRLSRSPGVRLAFEPDPDRDPDPGRQAAAPPSRRAGWTATTPPRWPRRWASISRTTSRTTSRRPPRRRWTWTCRIIPGWAVAARRRWRRSWRGARWRPRLGKLRHRESGAPRWRRRFASSRCGAPRRKPLAQLHRRDRGERAEGAARCCSRRAFGDRRTRLAPRLALLVSHNAFGCAAGATALAERGGDVRHARSRALEILDARYDGVPSVPRGWRLARATIGGSGAPALGARIGGESRRRGGRASVGSRVRDTFGFEPLPPTLETLTRRFRATGSGEARRRGVGDVATPRAVSPRRAVDLSANDIGECGAAIRVTGGEIVGFGGRRRRRPDAAKSGRPGTRTTLSRVRRAGRTWTALSSLADDLASARSLRRLDLGYNSLGDGGARRRRRGGASGGDGDARRGRGLRTRRRPSSSERGGGASSSARRRRFDNPERGGGVELDLQRNSIGNAGALALAEALGVADAPGLAWRRST